MPRSPRSSCRAISSSSTPTCNRSRAARDAADAGWGVRSSRVRPDSAHRDFRHIAADWSRRLSGRTGLHGGAYRVAKRLGFRVTPEGSRGLARDARRGSIRRTPRSHRARDRAARSGLGARRGARPRSAFSSHGATRAAGARLEHREDGPTLSPERFIEARDPFVNDSGERRSASLTSGLAVQRSRRAKSPRRRDGPPMTWCWTFIPSCSPGACWCCRRISSQANDGRSSSAARAQRPSARHDRWRHAGVP